MRLEKKMEKDSAEKNGHAFREEEGVSGKYLVLAGPFGERFLEYHAGMIANNSIEGILPFDVRTIDNKTEVFYSIGQRIPLPRFLKDKRVSGTELESILSSIINALSGSKNYLLEEKQFLLDEEYMYIDPAAMKVWMVYIPYTGMKEAKNSFKEFLIRFLMFSVEADESCNKLIQSILINAKRNGFSISQAERILNSGREEENVQGGEEAGVKDFEEEKPVRNVFQKLGMQKIIRQEAGEEKDMTHGKGMLSGKPMWKGKSTTANKGKSGTIDVWAGMDIPGQKGYAKGIDRPGIKAGRGNKKEESVRNPRENVIEGTWKEGGKGVGEDSGNKGQEKEGSGSKSILALVCLQLAIGAGLIFTLNSGVLDSLNEDRMTTYIAFAFVLGAVDFLIIRRLLSGDNSIKENNTRDDMEKGPRFEKRAPEKAQSKSLSNVPRIPGNRPLDKKQKTVSSGFFQPEKPSGFEKNAGLKSPQIPEAPLQGEEDKGGCIVEATALLAPSKDETEILIQNGRSLPYLKKDCEDYEEIIIIEKSGFIIGRQKGKADYISKNSAVGKLHAQFVERGGIFHIKDLSSKNGTFINEVRIDSGIEYEIRDKDVITLANDSFIYVVPTVTAN